MLQGELLDGGGGDFKATACGTVGDGDYANNLMAGIDNGLEGADGKVRGSHEDDSHCEGVKGGKTCFYRTRTRMPDLNLVTSGLSSLSFWVVV